MTIYLYGGVRYRRLYYISEVEVIDVKTQQKVESGIEFEFDFEATSAI